MELEADLWRSALVLLVAIFLLVGECGSTVNATASTQNGQQIGKILGVRKVARWQPYPLTIHPQIHEYEIFFSLRISRQTYCVEYTTPILEEINDLQSAIGHDVGVVLKKKSMTARIPPGRKIRALLVKVRYCPLC